MKTTLLVGALTLAVAAPAGYNIVKGYREKVHLVQAQLVKEQAVQQAQADVAATLRQIDQYRKRLPPDPSPSWLVTEAVALGEQSRLRFTTIDQESPVEFPQFTRLAATFEFTASYHELGAFLDRVERSERFIRVERLQVDPSREEGGEALIRLTLSTVHVPPVLSTSKE